MATYVNDLRLKEITTGDESGTWGTSTNTNLELIAEAFSFGTEAITTNADTHTTTVADGATDPGRSMYLKYTGSLSSACTITLGPNTISKVWIIENATSGSQNIIIKQGSGTTVTIPNGNVKVVYSDGAGSGGSVVDAFTDVDLAGTTQTVNLAASTAVKTPLIEYTDGDDAMTIADGGGVTFPQAATFTSGLDCNDANITSVGDIKVDSITAESDATAKIFLTGSNIMTFQVAGSNQLSIIDNLIYPPTNNDISLGNSTFQFKDGYFDGTLYTDDITNSGTVTSATFLYSSDAALKEDIQTIENPLEKVQALRGVSYKWKDTGKKDIGLVADEVEEVLPELVVENEHKQMDYGHMIGLLVEAIKEQQKEIEALKK